MKQAGQASQRLVTYGVKSQSRHWAAEDGPRGLQSRLPVLTTQFETAAWRGWERRTAEMLTPALPLWERSLITGYIDNSTANGCQLSTLLKSKVGHQHRPELWSLWFSMENVTWDLIFLLLCAPKERSCLVSLLVLLARLPQSKQVTGALANKNLRHVRYMGIYNKLHALRLFRSSTVIKKELYTFLPSPQPRSNEPVIPLSRVINIHAQPWRQTLPKSLSTYPTCINWSNKRYHLTLRSSTVIKNKDVLSIFWNPGRKRLSTLSERAQDMCLK